MGSSRGHLSRRHIRVKNGGTMAIAERIDYVTISPLIVFRSQKSIDITQYKSK